MRLPPEQSVTGAFYADDGARVADLVSDAHGLTERRPATAGADATRIAADERVRSAPAPYGPRPYRDRPGPCPVCV